jgi:hypothetical protein
MEGKSPIRHQHNTTGLFYYIFHLREKFIEEACAGIFERVWGPGIDSKE